jgi:hypothetical protein
MRLNVGGATQVVTSLIAVVSLVTALGCVNSSNSPATSAPRGSKATVLLNFYVLGGEYQGNLSGGATPTAQRSWGQVKVEHR